MDAVWGELLISPRSVEALGGAFRWPTAGVVIELWDPADEQAGGLIAEALQELGVHVEVHWGRALGATIRLLPGRDREPDGYGLTIAADGIEIRGDVAGRLYGAATLTEIIERVGLKRLAAVAVTDAPDFRRRALYLDCSRGKVPKVSTVAMLIPLLARWRINELQLYVEDVFTFQKHPAIGRDASPFRPQELLQMQALCERWQIAFVPSLASFGHLEKVLALPAYRHLGEKPGSNGYPGGTTLCPIDPGSIALMADLYDEYLPLFTAKAFNACGDEPWELGKGRCADLPGGTAGVYVDFLRQLRDLAADYGKETNVWADVIMNHPDRLAEVPKDLVLLNWDYEADAKRAARSSELAAEGLRFLVCPGTHGWKSHGTRLQTAIDNVSRSVAEARKWGAEGIMNTDWGDAGHRNPLAVSLHGFAHGGAHAWNGAAVDDQRFTDHFCRWMSPAWRDAAALLQSLGSVQSRVQAETYFTTVQLFDVDADNYKQIAPHSGAFWPKPYRRDWLGEGNAAVARELRSELAPLVDPRGLERFPNFQREVVMAANLERYALGRLAYAQDLRAGQSPSIDRRTLLREGEFAIAEFATCWRQRNRASRLKDNLALLNTALAELQ